MTDELDYMSVFYTPDDEDDATQERKDREAALHG